MVGDAEAFLEVKDQCGTWYQFMASWLLYTEPTVKSFDLSYHAHQCIAKFGGISRLKHSDLILLALMESNLHQVIFLIKVKLPLCLTKHHAIKTYGRVECSSIHS
jgi:hypothetical protein